LPVARCLLPVAFHRQTINNFATSALDIGDFIAIFPPFADSISTEGRFIKETDFRKVAVECARIADKNRADEIVVFNLIGIAEFCDYFVLCNGTSGRQLQAIAGEIEKQLKKQKVTKLGIEGASEARWILLDYGGVIVHLFMPDARLYYDFDLLWGDAKRVSWKPKTEKTK